MKRRELLKKIAAGTIVFSITPLNLFSNSGNELVLLESNKFRNQLSKEFLVSLSNQKAISKLNNKELFELRQGISNLKSIVSSKSFQNKSFDQQKKIITTKTPFLSPSPLKNPDKVKVAGSFFKIVGKAFENLLPSGSTRDSLAITSNTLAITMSGTSCLVAIGLTPATLGAATIPAITSCGLFLYEASEFFGGLSSYGNSSRSRTIEEAGTMLQIAHLNKALDGVFGDFTFDSQKLFGDLKLNFTSEEAPLEKLTSQLENNGFSSDSEKFIALEMAKGSLFKSKENFGLFLEEYLDKQGKEQLQNFKNYLEAGKKKDLKVQQKQREIAFFKQSLNNFIAEITPQFMGEKESKVFNTLMSIGFQYSVASFGPMGWAAVGLNIASVLSNNQRDPEAEFRKALFKALENIQQQLNTIIKEVEDLKFNQRVILDTLYQIMEEVIKNRTVINSGFNQVTKKLNLISQLIETNAKNSFNNDLAITINDLEDSVFGNTPTNNIEKIRDLMHFTEQLDDSIFTLQTDQAINGSTLADFVFKGTTLESESSIKSVNILAPSNNIKLERSLYDAIGILPIAENYSTRFDIGKSSDLIVHPVHFNMLSNLTLNWCIAAKIGKGPASDIHKRLYNKALKSRAIINECAHIDKIQKKIEEYNISFNGIITAMEEFLTESIRKDFPEYVSLEQKNGFSSNPNFVLPYRYNSIYKAQNGFRTYIENHSINKATLDNFLNNALDDDPDLKELNDWGYIQRIEILSREKGDFSHYDGNAVNINENQLAQTLIYKKRVRVTFKAITVFGINLQNIPSFSFEYESAYICTDKKIKILFPLTYHTVLKGFTSLETSFNQKFDAAYKSLNKFDALSNPLPHFNEEGTPQAIPISFASFARMVKVNHTLIKQKEYFEWFYNNIIEKNTIYQGIAASLMLLTQTNKAITSDKIYPYTIDYNDEVIHKEDFLDFFNSIFTKGGFIDSITVSDRIKALIKLPDFSTKLCQSIINTNQITLTTEEKDFAHNYISSVIINLLIVQQNTIMSLYKDCKEIKDKDTIPFLDDSLNKLDWFETNYLNEA